MQGRFKEYAMYKGDTFLFIGTRKEIAERLGILENSVSYYASDAYKRKLEKRGTDSALIAVNLGFMDEVSE